MKYPPLQRALPSDFIDTFPRYNISVSGRLISPPRPGTYWESLTAFPFRFTFASIPAVYAHVRRWVAEIELTAAMFVIAAWLSITHCVGQTLPRISAGKKSKTGDIEEYAKMFLDEHDTMANEAWEAKPYNRITWYFLPCNNPTPRAPFYITENLIMIDSTCLLWSTYNCLFAAIP